MTARKSNEQLEKELQEQIDALSNTYVELILKCGKKVDAATETEEDEKLWEQNLQRKADVKKQIDQLKRDLSFIKSVKGKVDKKAEKEKQRGQKDIVATLKKIKNSIGELIADIPKSHEK